MSDNDHGLTWEGFTPEQFVQELSKATTITRRESKKVLRQGAKDIMAVSQQMCPVDKHNLEKAHHIEDVRLSKDNMVLEIAVGGDVGDREVDEYAWVMHELLQPFGAGIDGKGRQYHLGPASRTKDAGNPSDRRVGGKFLERAVDVLEEEIMEKIAATLIPDETA